MFPVVNKPLLQWTFEKLAKANVTHVILAVSQRTETLFKQQEFPKCGLHVTYSRDPPNKPLGTGGPIKKAEKLLGHEEPFLVFNEDIFADLDYTGIMKAHEKNMNAVATIALHSVEDPTRYGVAELTKDKRIKRFIEKPKPSTALTDLINAGVYVLTPKIFEYIPEGKAISIERHVFPKLAEEEALYGHVFKGLWMDIGKPEDYLYLNRRMLDLTASEREYDFGNNVQIKKPVAINKTVSVGEESVIGPYTAVGKNATIGKKVHIQNSIIFPNTVISDSSSINEAIIGEAAVIKQGAKISEGCIISDGAQIEEDVRLAKKVSIGPGIRIVQDVLVSKTIC